LLLASVGSFSVNAQETELKTDREIASYAMGLQFGVQMMRSLAQQPVDLDHRAIAMAIEDVLLQRTPRFTNDELRGAMEVMQAAAVAEHAEKAETNLAASKAFLEKNKIAQGVVQTESGLQYVQLEPGAGGPPKEDDQVVVHYTGTLLDGNEFDSSHTRGEPATFGIRQVIPGWQEALLLMQAGGKMKVFVPPDLAYGEQGAGSIIGPNQALVFDIELLEIKRAP
jgi:FKBP-type peptidyl-prolyl cis-trans isomerase FklB